MRYLIVLSVIAAATLALWASADADAASRTCSSTLEVEVHGQHIIGDYVTGVGRANLDWPPKGGVVGEETGGEGVAIRGGPGPGFHFIEGFAPGASFCVPQSQSPGFHDSP